MIRAFVSAFCINTLLSDGKQQNQKTRLLIVRKINCVNAFLLDLYSLENLNTEKLMPGVSSTLNNKQVVFMI